MSSLAGGSKLGEGEKIESKQASGDEVEKWKDMVVVLKKWSGGDGGCFGWFYNEERCLKWRWRLPDFVVMGLRGKNLG